MDDEQEDKNEFDQDFDPKKAGSSLADDDMLDEDDSADLSEEEPADPLSDESEESLDEMADKELLETDEDKYDDEDLL